MLFDFPSEGVLICRSIIRALYSPGPKGRLSRGTKLSFTRTCSTQTKYKSSIIAAAAAAVVLFKKKLN